MTARWTATALAELDQILSYIAADNAGAAAELAAEIQSTIGRIVKHPQIAPIVHRADVRAVMAGRFDYRIFYAIRGRELIIRNVRSTKRQRPWE